MTIFFFLVLVLNCKNPDHHTQLEQLRNCSCRVLIDTQFRNSCNFIAKYLFLRCSGRDESLEMMTHAHKACAFFRSGICHESDQLCACFVLSLLGQSCVSEAESIIKSMSNAVQMICNCSINESFSVFDTDHKTGMWDFPWDKTFMPHQRKYRAAQMHLELDL